MATFSNDLEKEMMMREIEKMMGGPGDLRGYQTRPRADLNDLHTSPFTLEDAMKYPAGRPEDPFLPPGTTSAGKLAPEYRPGPTGPLNLEPKPLPDGLRPSRPFDPNENTHTGGPNLPPGYGPTKPVMPTRPNVGPDWTTQPIYNRSGGLGGGYTPSPMPSLPDLGASSGSQTQGGGQYDSRWYDGTWGGSPGGTRPRRPRAGGYWSGMLGGGQ